MRHVIILTALAAAPAAAQAPASAPAEIHMDVPQDKGPQQVNVLMREFPVGGSSGWHTHAGVEIGYLTSGEIELQRPGTPPLRLSAGQSMMVPRGMPHNAINVGTVPARVVITFVTDKGAPLRTPVPAPDAHAGH